MNPLNLTPAEAQAVFAALSRTVQDLLTYPDLDGMEREQLAAAWTAQKKVAAMLPGVVGMDEREAKVQAAMQ